MAEMIKKNNENVQNVVCASDRLTFLKICFTCIGFYLVVHEIYMLTSDEGKEKVEAIHDEIGQIEHLGHIIEGGGIRNSGLVIEGKSQAKRSVGTYQNIC